MAKYDLKSAKKYIQLHADSIKSATLGMHEDWFWTAVTVFEDGRFSVDLDEEGLTIGGITGSSWATPTLEIEFQDGTNLKKDCFVGDIREQKPSWFKLGCLSKPVQNERESIEDESN